MKNIYVGNIPFSMREEQLQSLFAQFGEVKSAKVITDKGTGRSKGFAFVEMEDEAGSQAIAGLDGQNIDGRSIRVSEARPKPEGGGFGGGGNGGGGGRGRFGGGRGNGGGRGGRDRGPRDAEDSY